MARKTLSGIALKLTLSAALLTSVSGLSAPAWAQDADANPDFFDLGQVVITARRTEEQLNEAPVAVTVVTDENLGSGRVDQVLDIAKTAPNVMAFDANGLGFVVRGVGSQAMQGLNSETGVGLFLDEVYMGRPDAAPVYLDDLERTEVVRGSQSTLYGRNTIGGAVNLVTREPGDVSAVETELSYGSNGYARARLAFDQPMGDGNWLTRGYLSYTKAPDGITNLATNQTDLPLTAISGRFTVVGDIGDATSLKFTIDSEKVDDDSMGRWAPLDLALNHQSNLDHSAYKRDRRGGAMLRIDHDFDAFYFSSITAYRKFSQDLVMDGDFSAGPYDPSVGFYALQQGREQEQWQFTQEFRLGSHAGSDLAPGEISWNAGLFYMYEDFDGLEFYELASVPRDMTSRDGLKATAQTYAAFGNISYQVSDALSVHAGARVTRETKSGDVEISSPAGTFVYGPAQSGSASTETTNFSPEAGFGYQLNDNTLVYGRFATGFKSGGIAQFFNADGSVNTYRPETSRTFELGLKTSLMDDRVSLGVNLFNTEWKDMQSNVFISDIQRVTANASSATSRGLELSLDAALSDELTFGATYGYLDARFDSFQYSFYSATTGSTQTVDYSGNAIPLSPKHSASLSLGWERELKNGLEAFANGTYSYRSEYTFDPVGAYKQAPTHLVDVAVGVRGGDWEASLWAKNLLDEKYLSNYFLMSGAHVGIASPGRTVGMTVSKTW
ncbi:iron complex outermembrane recepter protein [Aliiroseovarius halocynthiae]|nr:TonB-dependent receptor [Aliiroseovarius halocynthiae]SMR83530.1 iron complex outermembrane recepter protein [Aliiroseovarius halocynthiae]